MSKFWFLFRYGIVGIFGGILQTGVLYLWVDIFSLKELYLIGAAIGFCVALAVTFTLQKYWTYKDYVQTHAKRHFVLYTSIALVNLVLNVLLLRLSRVILEMLGLNFFHIWYILAQVAIVVTLALLSFVANNFLTFRATSDPKPY